MNHADYSARRDEGATRPRPAAERFPRLDRRPADRRTCSIPMPAPVRSIEDRLRQSLGEGLLTQEPLRHHTTFRIGGPADFFYAAPTPDQLVAALRVAHEIALPVFLLGGGSNLLVSDAGFRGLVVRNACETIQFDRTAAHVEGGVDFLELI
jgi:hypothetical protein